MMEFEPENKKKPVVICRCEDVTLDEIRNLIDSGVTDLEQIKRELRVGMGPCQGRTCTPLIMRELAAVSGKAMDEIKLPTMRQPVVPVKLGVLAGGKSDD